MKNRIIDIFIKLCFIIANFVELLHEILLLFIGIPVFLFVALLGLVYTFIKHCIHLDYSIPKQLTPIVRSTNLCVDGFSNSCAGELLNDLLKVKGIIRYGKWYQTISSVTGLRFVYEYVDNFLRKLLDKVLGKNHCVKAITKEDNYYYKNNNPNII